jgi:hypothetical protein
MPNTVERTATVWIAWITARMKLSELRPFQIFSNEILMLFEPRSFWLFRNMKSILLKKHRTNQLGRWFKLRSKWGRSGRGSRVKWRVRGDNRGTIRGATVRRASAWRNTVSVSTQASFATRTVSVLAVKTTKGAKNGLNYSTTRDNLLLSMMMYTNRALWASTTLVTKVLTLHLALKTTNLNLEQILNLLTHLKPHFPKCWV